MHAERALGVSRSGPGCSKSRNGYERSFYGIYGFVRKSATPQKLTVYHGLSWFIIIFPIEMQYPFGAIHHSQAHPYVPGILTARFLTNSSVDVWLAARDEQKTFDSQRSVGGGWRGPGLFVTYTWNAHGCYENKTVIRKFGCFQFVFETRSFEAVSDGPKWLSSQHRSQAASRIHCVFGSLSFVHPHCLSYPLFIGVPQ